MCIQRRDLHSAAKSCLATFAEEDLAVGTTCNLSLRNYYKTEKKQQFLRQIENTSCQLASLRNSPRDLLADDDTNSILSDGVKIVGEVIVVI